MEIVHSAADVQHSLQESREVVLESDIALWELAVASGAVFVAASVSVYFNLGLHTHLLLQAGRMVLQLTVLGIILVPVVEYGAWWIVLLVSAAMVVISSIEAVSRPAYTYKGMLVHMVVSIAVGVASMLVLAFPTLLRVRPLLSAQVFIPVLGTLLDAAVTGASAGLMCVLQELAEGVVKVEMMLAQGASRWEATQGVISKAMSAAMAPLLTHLGVVGLVTIPGVMSGMILQGASPMQASRLQACLVLLVVGTTALSSVACVLLAVHHLVDEEHMTRMDRLRTRGHDAGIGFYVRSKLVRVLALLRRVVLRVAISCCGLRVHGGGRGSEFWRNLLGGADGNRERASVYRMNSLGPASDDFDDFLSWNSAETSEGSAALLSDRGT